MLPPSAQRRISRLENDVHSIYEIMTEIRRSQTRQGARLDEHTALLNEILTLLRGRG